MNESCVLCETPIEGKKSYRDQDKQFCCAGCQAVYQILFSKQSLDNYKSHPLYQQAVKSGLISNPHLLEEMRQLQEIGDEQEGDYQKLHLEIGDMWCPSCAMVIRLIFQREKGVRQCVVDYATDLASIEFSPKVISSERIIRLIKNLGYEPTSLQDPRNEKISRSLSLRFIVAAFFSLNIMMFAYPIYASYLHQDMGDYPELFGWLSFIGSLPVLTYSGWPIWRRFFTGLRVGHWGMEALVFMGVMAATGLSVYELMRGSPYVYFDSMTVIIVFVLLGKMIESKAKFSAKDSLIKLMRGLPRRGRKRFSDGEERFVPLKEILPHDFFVVMSGEKIVLDGCVEQGEGSCDESLMTGESLPTIKKEGSTVLAGTILQQGYLVIKATVTSEETALYRIIEMVEQDIDHKSKYVRAADQIVKWFVPLVILLSLLTAALCLIFGIQDGSQTVLQTAIIRAVSVLLISCPCAIGIAAPLAESYVLNAIAKLGAIVRNRGCLPFLGQETVFVFDKTGTITEGKFTVLEGLESLSFEQKKILKGLVSRSVHPITAAINHSLLYPPETFDSIEEIIGRGMRGVIGDQISILGSESFLSHCGIIINQKEVDESEVVQTHVYFAVDGKCVASIILGDKIRPEAKELLQSLKPIRTLLVSGDSHKAVERVARECHFDEWHSSCHPLQKRELVDKLRKSGEIVAVMGDGINDAPALTSAHIGIAVVNATDISIQVCDLLLTTEKLQTLTLLRKIATQGRKVIKQNLFWAFFYNCLGIGLAMAGVLSPLFAAFAMVMSSIVVLFNAQRIRTVHGANIL